MKGSMEAILYDDTQEEYPDWGPIYLSAASKAILLNWYRKAQRIRQGKRGIKRRVKVIKNISDDEGDNDVPSEWTKQMLGITPATKAIAVRWVRSARAKMQQRAGKGAGLKESELFAGEGNFSSGKKSAVLRK